MSEDSISALKAQIKARDEVIAEMEKTIDRLVDDAIELRDQVAYYQEEVEKIKPRRGLL